MREKNFMRGLFLVVDVRKGLTNGKKIQYFQKFDEILIGNSYLKSKEEFHESRKHWLIERGVYFNCYLFVGGKLHFFFEEPAVGDANVGE